MRDDPQTEVEAIAQELEAAGLIEIHTDSNGDVSYTLTPKGAQVGRSMALGGDADAVLGQLLEARSQDLDEPEA